MDLVLSLRARTSKSALLWTLAWASEWTAQGGIIVATTIDASLEIWKHERTHLGAHLAHRCTHLLGRLCLHTLAIWSTVEIGHVLVETSLVPLLLGGRSIAIIVFLVIGSTTQVSVLAHAFGIELLEFGLDLLHLLLVIIVHESLNTLLVWLSHKLNWFTLTGTLLATLA